MGTARVTNFSLATFSVWLFLEVQAPFRVRSGVSHSLKEMVESGNKKVIFRLRQSHP